MSSTTNVDFIKYLEAMKKNYFNPLLFFCALIMVSCQGQMQKETLNQIQVIGSHNSYKIPIEQPLWQYLFEYDSRTAESLQYGHPSLTEQLDLGLRNLELDIFHDPLGGRFANPGGIAIVKKRGATPLPFDENKVLEQPGLKMFHVQDIDFRSHQLLFKNGLKEIKKWSDKHQNHTPILILINAKDSEIPQTKKPLPFTTAALDSIDMEIKSIFPLEQLITPDMVRGDFPSLEKAILEKGWPELDSVKGRFLFILDEKEEKINRYIKNHPSLKNRVLFVNSPEGNPEAAFRIINDPVKDFDAIKELVAKGYMVRTRADAGTKEARTMDYVRFEKAKASGAQVISTDYYVPSQLFPSQFQIIFKDGSYERIID
ncbi:MAG: phosphatidylinositol-specific phospholipase C1-like protein [Flavobacteriaceae bacterium]